jgi:hypothetical protein
MLLGTILCLSGYIGDHLELLHAGYWHLIAGGVEIADVLCTRILTVPTDAAQFTVLVLQVAHQDMITVGADASSPD